MDTPGIDAAKAGVWLQVHCRRCGRRGSSSPNAYGLKLNQRPLRDIIALLRCRDCGARGACRVWIYEGRR